MKLSPLLPLLFVIAGAHPSATTPPVAAQRGPVSGLWDLPGGGGFALGTLFTVDGHEPLFQFQATLASMPIGCRRCLAGLMSGTLDDPDQERPALEVEGFYVGMILFGRGVGTFRAEVRQPDGARAGELRGRFVDPDVSDGDPVGSFAGRWELGP